MRSLKTLCPRPSTWVRRKFLKRWWISRRGPAMLTHSRTEWPLRSSRFSTLSIMSSSSPSSVARSTCRRFRLGRSSSSSSLSASREALRAGSAPPASPAPPQAPRKPTVQEPATHAAQAAARLPVALPHDPLGRLPLTGRQLLHVLVVQGQPLSLIDIQLRDGAVVPAGPGQAVSAPKPPTSAPGSGPPRLK